MNLKELREFAIKATKGKWSSKPGFRLEKGCICLCCYESDGTYDIITEDEKNAFWNAEFITRLNPKVVIELLDLIETLQEKEAKRLNYEE